LDNITAYHEGLLAPQESYTSLD